MSTLTIAIEKELPHEHLRNLHRLMTASYATELGDLHYDEINITLRDDAGTLFGGMRAATFWGWLAIDIFWIDAEQRGRGYGRAMLARAEEEGMRRGARGAHFDTFSPTALRFYERNGYRLAAAVELPGAVTRYSLMKSFE
jgi:GNAT superfamily N-acetyltransferase